MRKSGRPVFGFFENVPEKFILSPPFVESAIIMTVIRGDMTLRLAKCDPQEGMSVVQCTRGNRRNSTVSICHFTRVAQGGLSRLVFM